MADRRTLAAVAVTLSLLTPAAADTPAIVALDRRVRESSGLVASRRHDGVLWTHGDSGNPPVLFAVDRDGRATHSFLVDAPNVDWEDMALAPGDGGDELLIADTGNNRGGRDEVRVIVVAEPDFAAEPIGPIVPRRTLRLRYPPNVEPFDSEALFVLGEHGYLAAKIVGVPASLYRFALDGDDAQILEPAGSLPIHLPVTGADVSADGVTLAVSTIAGVYRIAVPHDGSPLADQPTTFARHLDPRTEAVACDGDDVVVTSEANTMTRFAASQFD